MNLMLHESGNISKSLVQWTILKIIVGTIVLVGLLFWLFSIPENDPYIQRQAKTELYMQKNYRSIY